MLLLGERAVEIPKGDAPKSMNNINSGRLRMWLSAELCGDYSRAVLDQFYTVTRGFVSLRMLPAVASQVPLSEDMALGLPSKVGQC